MHRISPILPHSISDESVLSGFTTRNDGVSGAPYESLNVGMNTGDDRGMVARNRRIVFDYAGIDERDAAFMGQVHSANVRVVQSGGFIGETDGLVTAVSGIMLCVLIADCVPLLLYEPDAGVIGAVHCGWRSMVAGIAENAIEIMSSEFSADPLRIRAVIGPSAGRCCYEIGDDVACRLASDSVTSRDGRLYADLKTELGHHLAHAGVTADHVEQIDDCTICNDSLYYSYRRDGAGSGRMMGFIMLKGN